MFAWTKFMRICCLQWAVKDISTNREAKRFSPTFTIGGYPWYDCGYVPAYKSAKMQADRACEQQANTSLSTGQPARFNCDISILGLRRTVSPAKQLD